tara:strand:- start:1238 stop:1720 length:483 start_codon:yes stop_codon:yes gene_type:complete
MGSKFKAGKAEAVFSDDLQSFYTGFLDKVAPGARKIIDDTLQEIEQEAKKNWPKRQPIIRRNDEGRIVFKKDNSQNSWNRFQRGYRVEADGTIAGFLVNTAPYAWAIKFGVESVNNRGEDIIFPLGKRVGNELMVKPMRKGSKKVVDALADDLIKQVKKG